MMRGNPEFMRNLWLELTPQRLMATPAVLGLIFAVTYFADARRLGLHDVSLTLFVFIAIFWGAKLAADSLVEEFSEGTWDTQRLSGLSAWQMTLGKLLGGPVFTWYAGVACLGVYLLSAPPGELWDSLRMALVVSCAALSLHALSLLFNLMSWRKLAHLTQNRRPRSAALLLMLVLLPQFFGLISMLKRRGGGDIEWYGLVFGPLDFAMLCAPLALFWSVFGLYRAMREELAFRDAPMAWIAFLLFLDFFSGGWFYGNAPPTSLVDDTAPVLVRHLAFCALLGWAVCYLLLFGERKDWLRLRRMHGHWQAGRRRRAFELAPKWLVTLAFTATSALVFALAALALQPLMDGIANACLALAMLAFLLRDAAIVLGLNFTRDQKRSDAAAALYLIVLYGLLPALFAALHLDLLIAAVLPFLVHAQPPWLLAGLLQAALALDYARGRWRQLPQ